MKKFIIFITILTSFCSLKASQQEELAGGSMVTASINPSMSVSQSVPTTFHSIVPQQFDVVEGDVYRALEFRLSQIESSEAFFKSQASSMQSSLKSTGDILLGVQAEHKKLQVQYQRLQEENETLSLRPEMSAHESVTSRISELEEENQSLLALQEQWDRERVRLQQQPRDEITDESSPLIPKAKTTRGCWYGFTQIFSGFGSMIKGCCSMDYCGAGPCSCCRRPANQDLDF